MILAEQSEVQGQGQGQDTHMPTGKQTGFPGSYSASAAQEAWRRVLLRILDISVVWKEKS